MRCESLNINIQRETKADDKYIQKTAGTTQCRSNKKEQYTMSARMCFLNFHQTIQGSSGRCIGSIIKESDAYHWNFCFFFFDTSAKIKRTCRKAPGLGFSGIEARIPAARRVIVCAVNAKQNHIDVRMMQVQFLSMTTYIANWSDLLIIRIRFSTVKQQNTKISVCVITVW